MRKRRHQYQGQEEDQVQGQDGLLGHQHLPDGAIQVFQGVRGQGAIRKWTAQLVQSSTQNNSPVRKKRVRAWRVLNVIESSKVQEADMEKFKSFVRTDFAKFVLHKPF